MDLLARGGDAVEAHEAEEAGRRPLQGTRKAKREEATHPHVVNWIYVLRDNVPVGKISWKLNNTMCFLIFFLLIYYLTMGLGCCSRQGEVHPSYIQPLIGYYIVS